MKVYYLGSLFANSSSDKSKYVAKFEKDYYYITNLNHFNLEIEATECEYLKDHLSIYSGVMAGITDEKLIKILNKSYKGLNRTRNREERIIYEIIVDKDGYKYGKELFTGLLFPLEINPKIEYFYNRNNMWTLSLNQTYTNDNMARFEYILSIDGVASLNTINKYRDIQKNKKNFDVYISTIKKLYNENVFRKPIIEKEVEPLKEQNILTKLMEEIEYLLGLLKQYNTDSYNKLSLEYKKLKDNSNDSLVATDPSKKELENFLANVKLTLLVNENKKDSLSEYLTDAAVRYFNRLNSNELSNQDLNINDIDVLTEMFLSNKDNYTAIEQRNILTKFSMLYLFVTKANINNINIEDLKESYFSKNLKTIILLIFELYEINIITTPITITYNDNITIEKVIETIKSIQFNKIENDKIKNLTK